MIPSLWALTSMLLELSAPDVSPREELVDPRRFTLLRSFASSHASILSPSGQYLLSYTGNTPTLVDLRTGRELGRLEGHTGPIHDGHFSEDGRVVCTAGMDGTVRLWETATLRELHSLSAHDGYA